MLDLRHRLTLADIIQRLPNRPPQPEGAWEKALSARLWDEQQTVVIQRAIFESFPFGTWPDKIAARMAFKEIYPGKVREYGNEMTVSAGRDPDLRESVINEAVACGKITRERAANFLPHHKLTIGLDDLKRLEQEHA